MFCPGCGSEEQHSIQFCRQCGTDLRVLRRALESPESITTPTVSAREEIGRAFADRIRQATSAKDLALITEEVLPEVEKFLESPEEKRLRRLRKGLILASIGLGGTIAFAFIAIATKEAGLLFPAGAGLVLFFIGLSILINGFFLTLPKRRLPEAETESETRIEGKTSELSLPEPEPLFTSVTENTTRHLKDITAETPRRKEN